MKTIKNDLNHEIVINKSRFICKMLKINTIESIKTYLDKCKKDYPDATHYCYAYILNEYKKSSDDNEPGGTAGVPIMEVLNKLNLNYVLCIVIRYFGGIKLGVGGLIRAYSKAVRDTIKDIELLTLVKGLEITIKTTYDNQKYLDSLLKDSTYTKEYKEYVTYTITCQKELLTSLDKNNINYLVIREIEFTI